MKKPEPSPDLPDRPDLTVVGRITEALAARIVSGALAPGMRLRQDHFAAEFHASHVPVREAFRRLEAQGLVVSEPRRGVRVSPIDPPRIIESAEMRAALEALALRYALPNLTEGDLARARKALRASERSNDILTWEETNRTFHRALMEPCRMPRLLATIDDLHKASARFLFAAWRDLDWRSRSDGEHRSILEAASARDVGACQSRTTHHVLAAGQALVAALTAEPTR
ncbi:GntR family transcriptional regulator [Pendulispora albinea]|uniref:GntR family transcriptional regulator n=1 Tax=Pendulispora albinea TaxID=2741071 RepID=A0ABZ2M538_9BACT